MPRNATHMLSWQKASKEARRRFSKYGRSFAETGVFGGTCSVGFKRYPDGIETRVVLGSGESWEQALRAAKIEEARRPELQVLAAEREVYGARVHRHAMIASQYCLPRGGLREADDTVAQKEKALRSAKRIARRGVA